MYNISFFGASVTEQSKPGYTGIFKELIKNSNINCFKDINIHIHGYGSMHLFNAGIVFINEVIQNKPDFCFIDWFSTRVILENPMIYLDTIIYKLILNNSNCKICFLLFDRLNICQDRLKMYDKIKNYAKQHNIYYIELYNIKDTSEILRDYVHTNTE